LAKFASLNNDPLVGLKGANTLDGWSVVLRGDARVETFIGGLLTNSGWRRFACATMVAGRIFRSLYGEILRQAIVGFLNLSTPRKNHKGKVLLFFSLLAKPN
jgi:hypothetical protein